mgnify:CR=1 FL=1
MISVEILNPFILAAVEVLCNMVSADVSRGKLSLEHSTDTLQEITVSLSLVGQVQGTVLYSLSEATAIAFVGQMMGSPIDQLDALATSGIAELGNVITGRTTTKLAAIGCESTISTPSVILGRNVRIKTLVVPRIVVPLQTQYGVLEIHLAVTNGTSS